VINANEAFCVPAANVYCGEETARSRAVRMSSHDRRFRAQRVGCDLQPNALWADNCGVTALCLCYGSSSRTCAGLAPEVP